MKLSEKLFKFKSTFVGESLTNAIVFAAQKLEQENEELKVKLKEAKKDLLAKRIGLLEQKVNDIQRKLK